MADWTYLIADLTTNIVIGELPLVDVRMSKVLNGAGQLEAGLHLGDAKVQRSDVYDLTRPVRRVVYALRNGSPFWGGIIWASTYSSKSHTIRLGAADWWSYFDHRAVLETLGAPPYGATHVAGFSKIYTLQEQNNIARDLVDLAQSITGGDIMVQVDGAVSGISRAITYEGYDLRYVGDALRDLTNITDGPDIAFDVGAIDTSTGRPARIMRTGTPKLVQGGTPWTWDLGGNLLAYTWSSGGGEMATRAFAEGAGIERGTQIAVAENTGLYANGWPLLDTDDVYSEVADYANLQTLAGSLLDRFDLPTLGIQLDVDPDITPVLGEYAVGDNAFVVIPEGDEFRPQGLRLPVRSIGFDVTVDRNGRETVTLNSVATTAVA